MYGSPGRRVLGRERRTRPVAEAIKSVNIAQVILVAGGTIAVYLWLRRFRHSWWAIRPQARHRSPEQTPKEQTQSTQQVRGVGLRHVNPPGEGESETATDIDIIAIHGLDTKSPDTWIWKDKQGKKPDVNWLSDPHMLPSKVGQARIFTCDWPADLFKRSDSRPMTIEEFARCLLDDIKRQRSPAENKPTGEDRPILFIASCLGGIILMKALVMADHGYLSIKKATCGVVFLATPFEGTSFEDVAKWAEPGLKAWASIRGRRVTKLLDSMKKSFNLDELVTSFTQLYLDPAHPYQIMTFYELGMTNLYHKVFPCLPVGAKQLVDKSSATLRTVPHPLPLDRTHVMMNKFTYTECQNHPEHEQCPKCVDYKLVTGKIQEILGKIREGTPLERANAWIRDKHYTADRLKIERLSGDPLSMEQCYINLAIVKQPGENADWSKERSKTASEGDAAPQSSPFSRAARLNVETPDKKFLIELPELFDSPQGPDGQTKSPRRILIRGRAGVGKTTLCKKIVYEFTRGAWSTWSKLFDRVLWVPLRNLKLPERRQIAGYNFVHLFDHEYFSQAENGKDLAEALRHTMRETKSSRILFLLDGLDEVYQELNGDMGRFLKSLFDQPNLIITSRPHASLPILDHSIDLRLETIGFYPEQVSQYLKEVFSEEQEKVGKIQFFLENHQLVQDLVRIPIQLDALCHTYDSNAFPGALPETMTALYEAISHGLWKKDAVRLEKCSQGKQVTDDSIRDYRWPQLEDLVQSEVHFLERLAFTGLHSDVIDFDSTQHLDRIFSHFPLSGTRFSFDETLARLSFLRSPNPSSKRGSRSYHFLHLTFQEYFAARYFVRQWKTQKALRCLNLSNGEIEDMEPAAFLRKHKYDARYDIFWRLVTGLLDAKQVSGFFSAIEQKPLDLLGPTHQRLVMHCLSEVDSSTKLPIQTNLEAKLAQWILFECELRESSLLARASECPDQALRTALETASSHGTVKIRKAILRTLENSRAHFSDATVVAIGAFLKDDDLNVRLAAARALGSQANLSDTTASALIALLKDDDGVRLTAAQALGSQANLSDTTASALVALLKEDDVRPFTAYALGSQANLSDTAALALVALLKDDDKNVRYYASQAFKNKANLSDTTALALVALLKDDDKNVRYNASQAFGRQTNLSDTTASALGALLKDDRSFVRSAAAQALGRQADLSDTTPSALVTLLKDDDLNVVYTAATALGSHTNLSNTTVSALGALLKDDDLIVRSSAAQALKNQANLSDTTASALEALLEDDDVVVRSIAVEALGGRANLSDTTVSAIEALLEDDDDDVRFTAAQALRSQTNLSDTTASVLVALLKDDDFNVRSAAAQALKNQENLSDTTALALEALLGDDDDDVRYTAAQALGNQTNLSDTAVSALVALLKDDDENVRSAAARALENQANVSDTTAPALVALPKDDESSVRSAAARTLENQANVSDTTAPALVALLKDDESSVRSAAARAIGKQADLSDTTALVLVALLKDDESSVRSAAARAIGKQADLSDTTALALVALLKDEYSSVRYTAAGALENQANLSDITVSALVTLLKDEHSSVRFAAAEALGGRANLSDNILKTIGLLLESERSAQRSAGGPDETKHSTLRNAQFVESWYGSWLLRSFKEQLSLYVDGEDGEHNLCIINQPSGLRTACFEDRSHYGGFSAGLRKGRQLWNIRGYSVWDDFEGETANDHPGTSRPE